MDGPTDRDLASRAQQGDMAAFGELVQRYQHLAFNVCYRLLGHRAEAEDWAQETFLRAYTRLQLFDRERPFGPWLARIATNLCLNHLAQRRPVAVPLDEELDAAPPEQNPEVHREQVEQTEALQTAWLNLPPHYRAVMELRHFHDLSYAEIAEALQLPVSDVKSHLFRARKLLAQKLAG